MKCTREEMLEKAIRLFQEYGYEATTVNQICEACDVTKGSFYNYYKSKKDILLEYYNEKTRNYAAIMARIIKEKSYKEQLWRTLEYNIDATLDLGPKLLYHMMIADMEQGAQLFCAEMYKLKEVSPEYEALVRELIIMAQENGEITNDNSPEDLWYAYISGLLGVAMNWSASGGPYNQKTALRRLFDVVFV